jgi:hypothetical protein
MWAAATAIKHLRDQVPGCKTDHNKCNSGETGFEHLEELEPEPGRILIEKLMVK